MPILGYYRVPGLAVSIVRNEMTCASGPARVPFIYISSEENSFGRVKNRIQHQSPFHLDFKEAELQPIRIILSELRLY